MAYIHHESLTDSKNTGIGYHVNLSEANLTNATVMGANSLLAQASYKQFGWRRFATCACIFTPCLHKLSIT